MIDASLPPLCSSEWLQQKHRITSQLLSSAFPLTASPFPRCRELHTTPQSHTEQASQVQPLPAINKLGMKDLEQWKRNAWSSINQLSWHHCGGKGKRQLRDGGICLAVLLWMQITNFEFKDSWKANNNLGIEAGLKKGPAGKREKKQHPRTWNFWIWFNWGGSALYFLRAWFLLYLPKRFFSLWISLPSGCSKSLRKKTVECSLRCTQKNG